MPDITFHAASLVSPWEVPEVGLSRLSFRILRRLSLPRAKTSTRSWERGRPRSHRLLMTSESLRTNHQPPGFAARDQSGRGPSALPARHAPVLSERLFGESRFHLALLITTRPTL